MKKLCLVLVFPVALAAQTAAMPPRVLPASATAQLVESLAASRLHSLHLWRVTPPINDDGTVNAYIEIPRGDVQKWEFDMSANSRAVDRVMPAEVGGYPVNYGFVPQTVSYDGDPFDVLVLGPPLAGGKIFRTAVVGLMQMEDEKGLDSKVVTSPLNSEGKPLFALTDSDRKRIGSFFARYKQHEPGKFSKVPGWGSREHGVAYIQTTHTFFGQCAQIVGECRLR